MFYKWLRKYEPMTNWLQSIGVVVALVFGGVQIRDARMAIESSTIANEIALKGRISDLIVRINEVAIDHPEVGSGYTSFQRLHLIRLEYFFQMFNLKEAGIIDADRYEAETRYLIWAGKQPEFVEAWKIAGDQYPAAFRQWVDSVLK